MIGKPEGDSQEGLNRRGARNLIHIYGGGCRGNTGQSDEVSTVRDTGQLIKGGDTSLVSRRGGSRSPGTGPGVSMAPSCKTRSACHEETLTGNAKRELAVV
jgi:hypothetical protein